MPQILELFAFVVEDEDGAGGEGVPAHSLPINGRPHFVPMMGADLERIADLRPFAQALATHFQKRMHVYRWRGPREHVETIEPAAAPPAYACPFCGATSHNPNDVRERYCGRCHRFADPGSV